ncbi:MAG TPA: HEPN domain-containing protein [Gemmatimonadota bacterium]|nr:HEPN domain-containing protein [Gemmatimonadota bacterium]
MSEPDDLLDSARRMLAVAERDLELDLPESACLTAHRAAAMATQAWLERRGQAWVSDRVRENVGLSPAAGEEIRADAELLDRHRADETRRWEPSIEGGAGEARAVLDAAGRILAFVDERIAGE